MRMLIIGYSMGIRSERRLCEEVHLNLAYRWFCHLGLDGKVPDHSTFSRNRHGRFRQSEILPRLFETVVERCLRWRGNWARIAIPIIYVPLLMITHFVAFYFLVRPSGRQAVE